MNIGKKHIVAEEWGLGIKWYAQKSKDKEDLVPIHKEQRLPLSQNNIKNTIGE